MKITEVFSKYRVKSESGSLSCAVYLISKLKARMQKKMQLHMWPKKQVTFWTSREAMLFFYFFKCNSFYLDHVCCANPRWVFQIKPFLYGLSDFSLDLAQSVHCKSLTFYDDNLKKNPEIHLFKIYWGFQSPQYTSNNWMKSYIGNTYL